MNITFGPQKYSAKVEKNFASTITIEDGYLIPTGWASSLGAEKDKRIKVMIPDDILQDVINSGVPVKEYTSSYHPEEAPLHFLDIRVNTDGNEWNAPAQIFLVNESARTITQIKDNFAAKFDALANNHELVSVNLDIKCNASDKDRYGNPPTIKLWLKDIYAVTVGNNFERKFAGYNTSDEIVEENEESNESLPF